MTDAIDYLEGYLKGKSDGRKEVVEQVKPIMECLSDPMFQSNWHAKLKSWGI